MKNLLSWILAGIVAVAIFVLISMRIPIQTQSTERIELSYIFVDTQGVKHDIFEPVHGAATDWSFLFEEDGDNNINLSENMELEDKIKEIENAEKSQVDLDNLLKDIEEIKREQETKKDIEFDLIKDADLKQCPTPWGTILNHGESIIAYQQRSDAPGICNAQRRTCNNGILDGSYIQGACQEDVEYKYKKLSVMSYNTKILGELIQNPKHAKNDGAEFDTKGKIYSEQKDPISQRDNSVKDSSTDVDAIVIENKAHYNCNSPWGEVVKHGQFVKAYKNSLGFTDEVCQVELRLCLDGNLNGRYEYESCEYNNISSQDFKEGNEDVTKPSQELLDSISKTKNGKQGFWQRIINWFK